MRGGATFENHARGRTETRGHAPSIVSEIAPGVMTRELRQNPIALRQNPVA